MTDKRATGWKIPLLFCAVIILLVAGISLLMPAKNTRERPAFSPELLQKAQALTIDLQKDAESKAWNSKIISAGSGFVEIAEKEAKLSLLIKDALAAHHFPAACTAVVLIKDQNLHDENCIHIIQKARENCADLPWAVLGAHGLYSDDSYLKYYEVIEEMQTLCQAKGAD